ncbi:hypothetical protein [Paractinoplanes rishiriensis]|uniref:hypothetical protein n=1 Tax=Paractinoplanes rishiriensis TaxID=1050105 RepID=UPI00194099AB|nr:hypothetical protein [Actinoplanes rishiriensis]
MELTLPAEPVALAPGVPTRVPVQVRNPYARQLDLRIYLARGRAAGWATVEPETIRLVPGQTAEIGVFLTTPPEQPPSSSLVPFTVHAEEVATGEPAGFATALLTVALPVPVAGDMIARPGQRYAYDLRLVNGTGQPASLLVTAELDPPGGALQVQPDTVLLRPGSAVAVGVRAKPKRHLIGTPQKYSVVVKVRDGYDTERPPYLTEVATGTRKPRVSSLFAGIVAVVLALGATVAIVLQGTGIRLPFLDRGKATPVAQVTVGRPYALIDVFPHRGADGGRTAADAALARLVGAGMPVRLVDSLSSDVLADEGAGFWVLLQDGFGTAEAAQQFCDQWRPVAPKCQVTS